METTKICTKCKIKKELENFVKKKNGLYGLDSVCKICKSNINKAYREQNKKKLSIYDKEKYLNNCISIKKSVSKYYINNKKKRKSYNKIYRLTENGRMSDRLHSLKRRALKLSTSDGTITKYNLDLLLSIQNNKCYYCKCKLDINKHLDHYIPLSKNGEHSIYNVVWSCASCNLHKSDTIPDKKLSLFISFQVG